jgi:hypothetical protein
MPRKRIVETGKSAAAAGAAPAAKRPRARKAAAAAAAAGAVPEAVTASLAEFTPNEREEIERLAYSYWQERGCPHGSQEEDWFRAEEEVRRRRSRSAETDGPR